MNARNDAAGQCLVLPLDKLHLDPENPRLPRGMRTADESAILKWMLINGSLPVLMESIASSGYSDAEPLLVVPVQDGYVVVEGNRRLAALRLLHKPELASLREKTIAEIADNARHRNILDIPVICCRSRRELPGYMGYRHTSCIKPWAPREKTEHLRQLYLAHREEGESGEDALALVSGTIGTRPIYVRRLLDTLTVVEWDEANAFWENEAVAQNIDSGFSVIHTALAYDEIRQYVGLGDFADGNTEKLRAEATGRLFDWIFGNRKINDSRDLGKLARAIGNGFSLDMLEKGYSLDIAFEFSLK